MEQKKPSRFVRFLVAELDSNQRPSGYEPDELPTALSTCEANIQTKPSPK